MSKIQQITVVLCGTALANLAAVLLTPSKSFGKAVKNVCGIFFVYVIVAIISSALPMLKNIFSNANTSEHEKSEIIESVEKSVDESCKAAFCEMGINSADVYSVVNIDENNGIYIERIDVTIDYNEGECEKLIKRYITEIYDAESEVVLRCDDG